MKTEIVFLLDRSGSMSGLEADTIGGYNSFIEQQRQEEGEAFVTTILFDDNYEILHNRVSIKEVDKLNNKQYYARGMTGLLDAIGKTINNLSEQLLKEESKGTKVIFVITTDGEENASKEFKLDQIKNMIENKSDWQFIFLGANIDAVSTAASFGIDGKFASEYVASEEGTVNMYSSMSRTVSKYRATGAIDENWKEDLEGNE